MTTTLDAVLTRPPSRNEIEVSLFGPGVGECVVLHLGHGFWIVVDSCRDARTKRPAALDYLDVLGVPVHSDVRFVIVTHWHDDHMRGIADLFRAADGARLAISGALHREEFLELVSLRHSSGGPRGVQEMAELFRIAEERKKAGAVRAGINIELASANKRLLRVERPNVVEVFSLSPSSAATILAHRQLAELMPTYLSPVNDITQGVNDVAVVLHVRAGDRSLLLGSDLETNADSRLGWHAIVDSGERPQHKAEVFKVAHHGSVSGHDARVWTDMLTGNPQAMLTPNRSSRVPLPTARDTERIAFLTPNAFLTAPARKKKPVPRSRTVDKIVNKTVKARTVREGTVGHVRLRAPLTGEASWSVELFNGAQRLSSAA